MVMAYAGHPVRTALGIGAGTGKATRPFARRGIVVTATDPDESMLAELRKHVPAGVRTAHAAFEDLRPGERYGLVHAAAALHWTNPEGRWTRMAALLEPGGVFASCGGRSDRPTPLWRKLSARREQHSWRATRFRPRTGHLRTTRCSGRGRSRNGPGGSRAFNGPAAAGLVPEIVLVSLPSVRIGRPVRRRSMASHRACCGRTGYRSLRPVTP
ncbi:class I SAM-dependent methyltransferase [Streptomyces phaeoluteigriseus]|uniref:class I SAM-dependent methyltransferase n=1 Tax=Streptomyces phaeoluteigriseus TaxID=114686 RepID=UPI003184025D